MCDLVIYCHKSHAVLFVSARVFCLAAPFVSARVFPLLGCFAWLPNDRVLQSAILAGHDAVGRHDHAGDGTESDEFMLPDFMGYDSMIEEEVNRFFSIFPETAVGIGDTWERSIELQRPDESERSTQTEQYTLLEMPALPTNCAAVFGSDHGLCGRNRHGVARIAVQSWCVCCCCLLSFEP